MRASVCSITFCSLSHCLYTSHMSAVGSGGLTRESGCYQVIASKTVLLAIIRHPDIHQSRPITAPADDDHMCSSVHVGRQLLFVDSIVELGIVFVYYRSLYIFRRLVDYNCDKYNSGRYHRVSGTKLSEAVYIGYKISEMNRNSHTHTHTHTHQTYLLAE